MNVLAFKTKIQTAHRINGTVKTARIFVYRNISRVKKISPEQVNRKTQYRFIRLPKYNI